MCVLLCVLRAGAVTAAARRFDIRYALLDCGLFRNYPGHHALAPASDGHRTTTRPGSARAACAGIS